MGSIFSLVSSYVIWHYTIGLRDIIQVWKDLFYFFGRFFSIKLLIKTLFSPFERLHEGYKRDLNVGSIVDTFIFNLLMRVIGFVVRISTIFLGLCVQVVWVILGFVALIVWITLPVDLCIIGWFAWIVIKA